MNYILSKEAEKDLEKIWLYTFELWSLEQADRYVGSVLDEIEYVCIEPFSGFDYSSLRKGYWRTKVKSHFVFYKINLKQNKIEIIRVLHEMMDIENQLESY